MEIEDSTEWTIVKTDLEKICYDFLNFISTIPPGCPLDMQENNGFRIKAEPCYGGQATYFRAQVPRNNRIFILEHERLEINPQMN